MTRRKQSGFTIVELLIVIVVIGILAAIVIVAYTGIQQRAGVAVLESDLRAAQTQLELLKVDNDAYPADTSELSFSENTTAEYTSDTETYCLTVSSAIAGNSYYVDSTVGTITEGTCPGHDGYTGGEIADGSFIQSITSDNCPSTRTRAVDARDNHTYWVQELADGNCWMLTNLAYAGGGTNTYSDTKTLTNGTGGSSSYTTASYYVVPSTTNYTTEPTAPSTSTDGTGQYGYLYNWCGAMGGQATAACANATTPTPNETVSVCPAGWRLPTGNYPTGELPVLYTTLDESGGSTDEALRTNWLSQYGGNWSSGFSGQDTFGMYWSSSQDSASAGLLVYIESFYISLGVNGDKSEGFAVRCLAS